MLFLQAEKNNGSFQVATCLSTKSNIFSHFATVEVSSKSDNKHTERDGESNSFLQRASTVSKKYGIVSWSSDEWPSPSITIISSIFVRMASSKAIRHSQSLTR